MAKVALVPSDFAAWGVEGDPKIAEMIGDVLAQAAIVAPCLSEDEFPYLDAAKAILREAVLRRFEAGPGGVTTRQQGTGPFSQSETVDTRMQRGILQPRDITALEQLCKTFRGGGSSRGGSVNLDPHGERVADPTTDITVRPDLWFQINVPDWVRWEVL